MVSAKELLVTKAIKLKVIKSHPGHVILIGKDKDVYVINVYKMMVLKHFQYDIEGCVGCTFKDKSLIICGKYSYLEIITLLDEKGRINVLKDESETPQLNKTSHINGQSIFELSSNQEPYEMFSYVSSFFSLSLHRT
jgi:hypothetical protein